MQRIIPEFIRVISGERVLTTAFALSCKAGEFQDIAVPAIETQSHKFTKSQQLFWRKGHNIMLLWRCVGLGYLPRVTVVGQELIDIVLSKALF